MNSAGRKIIVIYLFFGLIALLCSCDDLSPKGSMEGRVRFKGTTVPISGARISVKKKETLSDQEGRFFLDDLPVGDQLIQVYKEDYDTFSQVLTVGEWTSSLDIEMTSGHLAVTVSGIVYGDYSGNPVKDISVVFMNPDNSESDLKAVTDSLGFFQIMGVPEGEWEVVARELGKIIYSYSCFISGPDFRLDLLVPETAVFSDQRDGRIYKVGTIGRQRWMLENLAYLPEVSPPVEGTSSEGHYYVYDFLGTDVQMARQSAAYQKYGVLYNWKAALLACPEGWRLPSDQDWKILERYLGMSVTEADTIGIRHSGYVGTKLMAAQEWLTIGGQNSSRFTALPAGARRACSNLFAGIGSFTGYWSVDLIEPDSALVRYLFDANGGVKREFGFLEDGLSVRCIKKD